MERLYEKISQNIVLYETSHGWTLDQDFPDTKARIVSTYC